MAWSRVDLRSPVAREYEVALGAEHRRRTGTVYTPDPVVELVLDLAGYSAAAEIERHTVLDPASGCGVFLVAAVRRLVGRLESQGVAVETPEGGEAVLGVVERNVFGVDKDAAACRVARQLVRDEVQRLVPATPVAETFFASNVIVADFLNQPGLSALAPLAPGVPKGLDFIIGNPPYVSATRILGAGNIRLRNRYATAHGRIDLYAVFIEQALQQLATNGILAFITPDKYLTSDSGRRLRELIGRSATVRKLVRFNSHRVFEDAAMVPCITVLQRGATEAELEYSVCTDERPAEGGTIDVCTRRIASVARGGGPWYFWDAAVADLLAALPPSQRTLASVARRVSAGIATGRDGVYVVDRATAERLEPDLLHPVVRGKDITPLALREVDKWLIVPYIDDAGESGRPPKLVDITHFPAVERHLRQHESELRARHCVRKWNKPWYDLHDPWSFALTATPKVVLPDVANGNRFAYDPGQRCPLHSAYYIIPRSLDGELLAAVLNAEIMEVLMRIHLPVVKDGFSRYRRQFLLQVPIPPLTARQEAELVAASRSKDLELVSDQVAHAMGLSTGQVRQVHGLVEAMRDGHRMKAQGASNHV